MIRNSLGMSQMDLADLVGLSFQQIQKYEKGTTRISVYRLEQIARALGVSMMVFFLEDSGQPPQVRDPGIEYIGDPEQAAQLNKENALLLKLFRQIKSPKTRKGIIDVLRGMS